jgi:hypothetical protein
MVSLKFVDLIQYDITFDELVRRRLGRRFHTPYTVCHISYYISHVAYGICGLFSFTSPRSTQERRRPMR